MSMLFWNILILLLLLFGVALYFIRDYYEQRIKKEMDRAQKSETLKSVFLANASHSLRAPLKAIQGYSKMILSEQPDTMNTAQVKELAGHINKNTEQLIDFVAQLLELSNFEGSLPSFTLLQVNLAELMASYRREALNITRPDVSVRMRTDLSPYCKALLDTNFMHQLMMHLLTIAAQNTPQGEIVINYTSERKGLKVTISYTGVAQAELMSSDIYAFLQKEDALASAKNTPEFGLSICKAIIDILGGDLDIDTTNGRKTVATIWFPCRMVDRYKGM